MMLTSLVFLIEQIALGVYIFIAVGVLLTLRGWWRSTGAYRATHFELEREIARYRRSNSGTALILLVELALLVFGVQRIVAPTLRAEGDFTAQVALVLDDGDFRTPTSAPLTGGVVIDSSGVVLGAPDTSGQIIATPTLTPTPVGTIVPNAPPPIGCDTPFAMLQIPASGMRVFEPTVVRGTAYADDFAFYKFELNGPATFNNWSPVTQYTAPIAELGELGQFVPSPYDEGEYRFRVIVFDVTNAIIARCEITIFISPPIPSATPLGTPPPAAP